MSGRYIIIVCMLVMLSACTTTKPVVQPPAYVAPEVIIKKPQIDVMTAFDNGSVTVYPLRGDIRNPFTNKQLQPISQKVIGEGYPVLDPSVSVYPLKPPTSIPSVAFDDVQTGAASNLYSAKVKALASQRAPIDAEFPALPSTMGATMPMSARDVIGAGQSEIKATPLAPITEPAIEVPELPAAPVQPKRAPMEIFTPAGKKMGPVGSNPVPQQAPAAAPMMPMTAPSPKMQPVYDDAPLPIPEAELTKPVSKPLASVSRPLPPKLPTATKAASVPEVIPIPAATNDVPPPPAPDNGDMLEGDIVPMPPIPSLTGY